MDQAEAELRTAVNLDDADYIRAATQLAGVRRWYAVPGGSMEALDAILARTRERFENVSALTVELRTAPCARNEVSMRP